jgi:ABC-type nitrate/sulfonate/bicarbonate transport system substrate-binding protein
MAVAAGEGFFEKQGLNVDIRITQEDEPPFLAGQTPISSVSAWDCAEYIIEGEDVMICGTGGGTRFFNGIAVRPDSPYQSVQDLVGQKLGNPGFGTGAWAAFEGLSKYAWNIDAQNDFDNVTASPGALLGLLETGEIEGALLFSGQTVAAQATGFRLIFSFSEAWEELTGQPLLITAWVARTTWLQDNIETMRKINAAMDEAVDWMARYPDQFGIGGRYEINASQAGWLGSDDTTKLIQSWLRDGKYFVKNDIYTQAWIDASQEFNNIVFAGQEPAKEALFWPPEDIATK